MDTTGAGSASGSEYDIFFLSLSARGGRGSGGCDRSLSAGYRPSLSPDRHVRLGTGRFGACFPCDWLLVRIPLRVRIRPGRPAGCPDLAPCGRVPVLGPGSLEQGDFRLGSERDRRGRRAGLLAGDQALFETPHRGGGCGGVRKWRTAAGGLQPSLTRTSR